jgi:aryl carrier-like protein
VGELYTGGEGVALGYLGKPELTAQRFVPHPDRPEEILYRTGDFARWRADGAIEFLGRIDGQLKISGMRVELDEIEAVISEVEEIGDVAVTVSESASGGRSVHAFVTLKPTRGRGAVLDLDMVNRHIAQRLPRHMHPATIRMIDSLPWNANGKVDRGALLKLLEDSAPASAPRRSAPQLVDRIALEARIGAIWADVLGLASVERDDAIFDLGADSLQILRIGARMAEQGMKLESQRLLTNPTIAEIASMLGEHTDTELEPPQSITPLSAYRRGGNRRSEA